MRVKRGFRQRFFIRDEYNRPTVVLGQYRIPSRMHRSRRKPALTPPRATWLGCSPAGALLWDMWYAPVLHRWVAREKGTAMRLEHSTPPKPNSTGATAW